MNESFNAIVRINEENLGITQQHLDDAKKAAVDAMELVFIGLCLRSVQEYLVQFHELQLKFFRGQHEPNGMNLNSFGEWLASKKSWTRWTSLRGLEIGELYSSTMMVIYDSDNFRASQMTGEAERKLAPIWLPRLPGIMQKLRVHPMMDGLPPIELVTVDEEHSFKFTIRFAVD